MNGTRSLGTARRYYRSKKRLKLDGITLIRKSIGMDQQRQFEDLASEFLQGLSP
jgi:hypothetical protein